MTRRLTREHRVQLAAVAIAAWLAVSPWAWGFAGSRPAIANHVFMVLGFGPLLVMASVLRPAAVVTAAAGAWLLLSPWVLGYADLSAAWLSELITGALLIALSAGAAGLVSGARRRSRGRLQASGPLESAR